MVMLALMESLCLHLLILPEQDDMLKTHSTADEVVELEQEQTEHELLMVRDEQQQEA